eukprot:14281257-Ditylum_brightwellii.AAC.1
MMCALLVHSSEEVKESNNIIKYCVPTVPKEGAGSMPEKYIYDITFNREAFKGTFDASLQNRDGTYKKDINKW